MKIEETKEQKERIQLVQERVNIIIDLLNEHREDLTRVEAALYLMCIRKAMA